MSFKNRYGVGTAALVLAICACPLQYGFAAVSASKSSAAPFALDARVNGSSAFKRATAARPGALTSGMNSAKPQLAASVAALAALTQKFPSMRAHYSPLTGALAELIDAHGWLTSTASQASSESIVRTFLSNHQTLFGLSGQDLQDLTVLGDSSGGGVRISPIPFLTMRRRMI